MVNSFTEEGSDCSDDDISVDKLISVFDGLSSETLAALRQFQEFGDTTDVESINNNNNNDNNGSTQPISSPLGYMAFTQGDVSVIEETYKRLQAKENTRNKSKSKQIHIVNLECEKVTAGTLLSNFDVLERDGVVRLNGALGKQLCQDLLGSINLKLKTTDSSDPGFGNVFSRDQRYDMYLRPEGLGREALQEMMHESLPLAELFKRLLKNESGVFHELSSIIVDPGACAQPLHPDAKYSASGLCPVWTVFCALQDIEETMGPTVMLPGSHTQIAHDHFNSAEQRQSQLDNATFVRASLQQGDVAVMDGRCLHYGSANTSDKRRVLFYFTIRNPAFHGEYPDCGSLFDDVHLSTDGIAKLVDTYAS